MRRLAALSAVIAHTLLAAWGRAVPKSEFLAVRVSVNGFRERIEQIVLGESAQSVPRNLLTALLP